MNLNETPIYLDYNATTPIAPVVREEMLPFIERHFGNPSSDHMYGHVTATAVERARLRVANLLGCEPGEVVFTASGSESDNMALVGRVWASRASNPHLITSVIEHPAVLNTCRFLERHGVDVSYLPVDSLCRIDPDDVRAAILPKTVLVSIMHANNETGTLQPIREISSICREAGVPLHTDASQSVGKVSTRVDDLGVDLLTIAGHKLYAPKGIGALYIRSGIQLEPLVHGAGHEGGRRAGTENVPYIVALGSAAALALGSLAEEEPRRRRLRDRLQQSLEIDPGEVAVNGHATERLPNTLNLRFGGLDGNQLLAATPGIAASTGSACHAGLSEPSPVLLAMGIEPTDAIGAVRLSLGRPTTADEIDRAAQELASSARELRAQNRAGSGVNVRN